MMEKFNYYEFIKIVERTSLSHPFVNDFHIGRYRLNSLDDVTYGAIEVTINNVTVTEEITTINFNMLYVDRLTETRENCAEIHSVGIDVVTEIFNALKTCLEIDSTANLVIRVFNEQFADGVAGVFTVMEFDMPSHIGACNWLPIDYSCEKC